MTVTRRDVLKFPMLAAASSRVLAASGAPNVILIFCDDLGYGDLGCYGSKQRTPNLDRMAKEGEKFTHFYSANPVCSPSRAALLTGRYPTRVGVPKVLFPPDQGGLNLDERTLADVLRRAGYRTHCIGKWHLGRPAPYLPKQRGFDTYFGIPYSNDMTPRVMVRDDAVIEESTELDTLTPRYTAEAVRIIEQKDKQPFFLYLPHTYPHIPLGASPRFRGKSPFGLYGDVIEELDWSVGEILAALKRTGQDRNTLVLFSSDNGPWFQGSSGGLRGRKGMTWDGGVRVPFLAWMPGRIPAGRVVDTVASTLDLLPTIARLAGASLPEKPLDGVDLWPVLSGRAARIERPQPLLYFEEENLMCARWRQWKLHVARYNHVTYSPAPATGRRALPLATAELYDLVSDPDESFDVSGKYPEVVREIREKMEQLIRGFPEPIIAAWEKVHSTKVAPTPPGAIPRPAPAG